VLNSRAVQPIGRCIYCGATEGRLGKEHVIPRGLGGTLVLPKASCDACSNITSAFELELLRKFLINVRSQLNLPSYDPKRQPATVRIEFRRKAGSEVVDVPIKLAPAAIILLCLAVPGYFSGRVLLDYQMHAMSTVVKMLNPADGSKLLDRYHADGLSVETSWLGYAYVQELAKIAYGVAVAKYGLDAVKDAVVLPGILGRSGDLSHWVGGVPDGVPAPPPDYATALHQVAIFKHDGALLSRVGLFTGLDMGVPEHLVVIRKATEDAAHRDREQRSHDGGVDAAGTAGH
jgi:hypothetical protein